MKSEGRQPRYELDHLPVGGGSFCLEDQDVSKAWCGWLTAARGGCSARKHFFWRSRSGSGFAEMGGRSARLEVVPGCADSLVSLHRVRADVLRVTELAPARGALRLREAESEAPKPTRLVNIRRALRGVA